MSSEQEIAERLKQNLPKPEPDSTTDRVDDANPVSDQGYVADIGDSLDMYKLYDFFEIQTQYRTSDNEKKLQEVYRWAANQVQSTDYLAVAKVLMALEQGMAGTMLGSRLERAYQYIKLQQQIDRLKEQQGWL